MAEGESYKYLGVLESKDIQHVIIEKSLMTARIIRIEMTKDRMHDRNSAIGRLVPPRNEGGSSVVDDKQLSQLSSTSYIKIFLTSADYIEIPTNPACPAHRTLKRMDPSL